MPRRRSVLAAGACICVIALWVRSFMVTEGFLVFRFGHFYKIWSERGGLIFDFNRDGGPQPPPFFWKYYRQKDPNEVPQNVLGFRFVHHDPNGSKLPYRPPYGVNDFSRIPYWFFLLLAAAI